MTFSSPSLLSKPTLERETMKKISSILIAITFAAIGTGIAAPAYAAPTFGWASSPLTNLDPAGATINGGFTKFPTKAGLYIQECVAPIGDARPATCSDTLQLWITSTGAAGSISSTGGIAVKVAGSITGKGVAVDCTKVQCGLFFRYDHTAPTDFSEDTFYPISFKAGATAPALSPDKVTVTLNGVALVRNVPSTLAYRADAKIAATTLSGLPVTLTSLTPDCSYVAGKFTALKGAGQCALAYSTAGNSTYAAASGNFPFLLALGTQSISVTAIDLKRRTTTTLPDITDFGSDVTYTSTSKRCSVDGLNLKALFGASCVITATAPGSAGKWAAMSQKIVVTIK